MKFKKGDLVRCIDVRPNWGRLTEGKIYVVSKEKGNYKRTLIELEEDDIEKDAGGYYEERFELVKNEDIEVLVEDLKKRIEALEAHTFCKPDPLPVMTGQIYKHKPSGHKYIVAATTYMEYMLINLTTGERFKNGAENNINSIFDGCKYDFTLLEGYKI